MLGMEMMLKSLGLNPEEIKKSIGEFGQVVIDMKEQLDRIEKRLNTLFAEDIPSENGKE